MAKVSEVLKIDEIKYRDTTIRTVYTGHMLYFSVTDIAKAMGMANGRITRAYFGEHERFFSFLTPGGKHKIKTVSFNKLLDILKRSRKPDSSEVLKVVSRHVQENYFINETSEIPGGIWIQQAV